ncbi:ABC-F family ATP-binding cassette domain-containing protein [Cuneatibacter caecimuris]|uniref:ATP-binding cassette subfamily F protein uup n=1 Tax=Cuneatibacter caecimuris TaxID=1796618 RepID=A0A4Q7PLG1_9FIRM|nr:ABC-F family ATP-binding cassette domain-containing protein [Cuneatibacter caecimuris]RZT00691.1 ATP-binding cassette subfamily F protein uup [Cuneatibacter caecimuris]
MNLLSLENIRKTYTERPLFNGASFYLNENEKVGLIGVNGTGKSTLLRIAAGLEEPEEGRVVRAGHVKISYLSQTPEFPGDRTVLECVAEPNRTEENAWSIEAEAKAMLQELGIRDFGQNVNLLSGGQKKRVALAAALLAPADILILDEPTNHLDSEMCAWLEAYLKNYRGALLMVTHDRYFLDQVSNRIAELDQGQIYSYQANYAGFLELKAQRLEMETASERKRQSILRNELAWIMRGARARSTKQKGRIQRFEELQNRRGPEEQAQVEMESAYSRLGRTTVELESLGMAYEENVLFRDFSYIFLKDDRVGFIGPNGCGKSTLMKLIAGKMEPWQGQVVVGQTVKIGYFSQENEYLDETVRVIDAVREKAEYVRTADGLVSASQMLERFLFPSSQQYSPVSKLSGGEKRRLYLLQILMTAPNVLILDEPTNDLDIRTLQVLEDYLDQFAGIVIAVSHDRYFLDRVVRRIFAFENGGRIRQYEGGYTDYSIACLQNRSSGQETAEKAPEKKKTENRDWKQGKPVKLKFSYKEQKEFENIEDEIAALEEELGRIEQEMMENATNSYRLAQLEDKKNQAEQALEEKMERWVYLNDLNEKIEAQDQ